MRRTAFENLRVYQLAEKAYLASIGTRRRETRNTRPAPAN
jgi:hypothetical protein